MTPPALPALPRALVETIREQRAVLFLGAGASRDADHPNHESIPQGDDLRDLICDKFLTEQLKQRPLHAVAALAASEAGLVVFQSFIRELLLPFRPAPFHLLIPTFHWRAIVTTNFDLILERAYKGASRPLQHLVKTIKDGDRLDDRLRQTFNPVPFYKLHGCIDSHNDLDIPLIIGAKEYAAYDTNRKRFYRRFRDVGSQHPIIFAGYSLTDPHIQKLLFDLTDSSIPRPPFYLVTPDLTPIEQRYWVGNRVHPILSTFESFLSALDNTIPKEQRAVPLAIGGGDLSIRTHYRVRDAVEPQSLRAYLATDATHVHSGLVAPQQNPQQFYQGYDSGWGCIRQDLDVPRRLTDSVLFDGVLVSETERSTVELFMLKGPGGNGKTVSLKRIAWEAAVTHDQLVFFCTDSAGLRIDPLAEIHALTGKRMFLFVDRVALLRDALDRLLKSARDRSIHLTVFGAERDNEWNIYCEHLEPFVRQEFAVRYLSAAEIRKLLQLLEEHDALGMLASLDFDARFLEFHERAQRQLLVALHEATLGQPFEDIVIDEFRRIEPEMARSLYLDICTLHQFGAPVRAGLVSRVAGLDFARFQRGFMKPLENIVHVERDARGGDLHYRSRHHHVAEIVFNRMLPTADERFDLLAKLVSAMNADYSSDRETLTRLIRGRTLADKLPRVELGRLFYDRVHTAMGNDAFVLHQRAVFEMQHDNGSLEAAREAADQAYTLNPRSNSIVHTQAEIARRLANETFDPLKKRALRRVTRRKLEENSPNPSEYDLHTRALLSIDELKDVFRSARDEPEAVTPARLLEATKETETSIQASLQVFPDNAALLTAEATFREFINQDSLAQSALERAFQMNPRQDWLAVRLARRHRDAENVHRARQVLEECIASNPSSKAANLELGLLLAEAGEGSDAVRHLLRSFTPGDNQFEAQFWCARQLFLEGDFERAHRLFDSLHERAPGRFRRRAGGIVKRNGQAILFEGTVKRREHGYAFLRLTAFPMAIYASRGDSDDKDWDALHGLGPVECALGFARRGPRAVDVRPVVGGTND